jgi:MOSC domain-containing protein YiiM
VELVTTREVRAIVLSVNVGRPTPNPYKDTVMTGIDKRPADEPVYVRPPGSKRDGLGSGLVGDTIGDREAHGGDDQAVYAYAREDLDHWERQLGRPLAPGAFGENLTTSGIDVNRALIGERWRIGDELELQITDPRIPCSTFRGWIGERGWLKTFTEAARCGAYLRVVSAGYASGGDPIVVTHRPDHDVTVELVFRALTRRRELLPRLLAAGDDLPEETRTAVIHGETFDLG